MSANIDFNRDQKLLDQPTNNPGLIKPGVQPALKDYGGKKSR